MILVLISSFPVVSTLPQKAMAQTAPSEGARVLVDDAIQALKANNAGKAKVHLSILNQQLPTFVNSASLEYVKVLLDDAISALNSGDVNKAIVHLNLIKQQFANTTNNAPLMKNPATSNLSMLSNGTISSTINGYVFVKKWGSEGVGNGQFDFQESVGVYGPLAGIATDSSGNVYVSDQANDRIQKFDSNGNFIIIMYLESQNIVNVNWDKLQIASQNAVSSLTNAAVQFPLTSTTTSSSNFALPMTGSAALGFDIGFLRS